ncbi:hypothetical protein [Vibrio splendidus]|uniref:hypothetical protein n=1 Tax=Vibrio splendidus TaxID=29497 RepID=UPI0024693FD7|nr:hypothetical protein [Vibrio splendidus]MDH5917392.1 hypothetical protein [Vibrio splendidus]
MKSSVLLTYLFIASLLAFPQELNVINGLDLGPLAKLVGVWKTVESGRVDIAPGQEGSMVGKGGA